MKKLIGLVVVAEDAHVVWTIKDEILVDVMVNDRSVVI